MPLSVWEHIKIPQCVLLDASKNSRAAERFFNYNIIYRISTNIFGIFQFWIKPGNTKGHCAWRIACLSANTPSALDKYLLSYIVYQFRLFQFFFSFFLFLAPEFYSTLNPHYCWNFVNPHVSKKKWDSICARLDHYKVFVTTEIFLIFIYAPNDSRNSGVRGTENCWHLRSAKSNKTVKSTVWVMFLFDNTPTQFRDFPSPHSNR